MIESEPGNNQDIAVFAAEGIGEIGGEAVKLPPGIDIGEAPVRVR